ncbi:FepA family TonB-dependent siderophore receptor [Thauera sp. SDU_THAU2]|uniref:FepA family TonB-dependent siderophore receptor n=1 Tax=Thauera sp. SDU_THAU2 TaxID=3136633 RepID=UPI00311DA0AF
MPVSAPTSLKLTPLAFAVGSVLFAHGACAQQAASGSPETTLSEVRVLGTAEETLKQMTGVSIITSEDLEKRPPANDLAEILMTQPGVSLSGTSSVGAYGNQREIDLRGMGAENTMILVDGKPVNSRQGAITRRTGDRDTGGDSNWVPADQIERIEVIRGPAAARYGSGASGGVINIITKKPGGSLSGSVTTYLSKPEDSLEGNGTRRLGFNLSGPLAENLSFRLYGNAAKTGGDKPQINGTQLNATTGEVEPYWYAGREGRRNRDVNGLVRWDLTPDQVLEFEAGFSRQGNIYAGESSTLGPTGVMQEWADKGAETRRVYRQQAAITHRGKWGELGDSRITFQYENTRTINCRQGSSGMGEGNCSSGTSLQQSEQDNYFLSGELNTPLQLGGIDQMLTTGFEYRRQALADNNALLTTGQPDPLKQVELKNTTKAVFVEDNMAITDAFLLTPGLRLDHHSQFGTNWSPSLNAMYELGSGFTLKGGIARTFKAPNPYQTSPLYASGLGATCPYNGMGLDPDSYDCTVRGNPDLKPEISVNKEIGLAWDGPGGWDGSLTYFRNDYKNKVLAEALDDITDLDNPVDYEWVNAGKVLIHGWEGNLSIPLLGHNGSTLRLINNFTWMLKNHNKDTGQPVSIIPKYTLNTTLQWQATEQFSMQLTGTFYGRRKPRTVSYHGWRMIGDAVQERSAYALLGLNGTWEINKNHRVGFGISNLFDKEIKRAARLASANSPTDSTIPFEDRVVSTGAGAKTYNEPGRAYYVTYTASF